MTKEEIWKPITGFEGRYEVSNLGRVRSLGIVTRKKTRWGTYAEFYRKPHIMAPAYFSNGYLFVSLTKESKVTVCKQVHRLVAEAFIPNPNGYPIVNHKDENKQNNRADNLEWCTHSYNLTYGSHIDKVLETRRKNKTNPYRPKYVEQYALDGTFLNRFRSLKQAEELTGTDRKTIRLTARGAVLHPHYIWKIID